MVASQHRPLFIYNGLTYKAWQLPLSPKYCVSVPSKQTQHCLHLISFPCLLRGIVFSLHSSRWKTRCSSLNCKEQKKALSGSPQKHMLSARNKMMLSVFNTCDWRMVIIADDNLPPTHEIIMPLSDLASALPDVIVKHVRSGHTSWEKLVFLPFSLNMSENAGGMLWSNSQACICYANLLRQNQQGRQKKKKKKLSRKH